MTGPGYININDNPAALSTFGAGTKPDVAQPSSRSRAQQQGAEGAQQSVSDNGADPAYIARMEQFEGHTHEEIYRNVTQMSPGVMHQQADTWISIADTLSGGLLGTHIAIQKALADGVEGQMADAAVAAAQKFYQQASDVQQVISTCGHRVKGVAHAAEVIKMSVPPPSAAQGQAGSATTLDPAQVIISAVGAGLVGDGDSSEVAYQRGVEALYRTAIDTMNNSYKPSYGPAGTGVPTFVPVSLPGDGGGVGDPGSGNGNGNGSGGGNPGDRPTSEPPTSVEPAGSGQNSGAEQQSAQTPTTPSASTAPAAATVPEAGALGSGQPGGPGTSPPGGPGTSPPGGGGPSKSGTPAPGGIGTPSPGRSISGLPTAGSPAAATASAANRAAAAGRPGMSGMPAAGAGKKQDDSESARKTPDYLIVNREEELLGAPQRMVPPTIGDDAAAAQQSPPRQGPPQRSSNEDRDR
ncbi:hypothetical protein ACFQZZ_30505 [Nocardia sp. GCM10030253]|uniref:hypothetical protein n=1 Tax=Nocardia sp. GCM10030253 TaxID=3273404 RepID=UPI00363FBFC3